jgi:hypothetical protein
MNSIIKKIIKFHFFIPSLFFVVFLFMFFMTYQIKIYADDAGFISSYKLSEDKESLNRILHYVPGRNLHILWQDLGYYMTAINFENFWRHRILQTFLFTLVGYFVYKIVCLITSDKFYSLLVGLLVIFFPIYQDVNWWANALPQHIISSLFVLLIIIVQIKIINTRLRFLAINILAILAIFTYDQSAAVAFFLLTKESYSYWSKSKNSRNITATFIAQSTIVLVLIMIYIQLVLNRNGNGPELSNSSVPRFLRNLLLPLFYVLENEKYLKYILIAVGIFLLILYKVAKNRKMKLFSYLLNSSNSYYLGLAFAAYVPIAVWWVSPRHLFLPGILFAIWLAQVSFSLIQAKVLNFSFLVLFTSFLLFFSICATSALAINKTNFSLEREKFYFSLIASIPENKIGNNCYFFDNNSVLNNLFRYEAITHALAFYSGNNQFSRAKCSPGPFYKINPFEKCFLYITTMKNQYGWQVIVGDDSKKYSSGKFEIYNPCSINGS